MIVPDEYTIKGLAYRINNISVYRADHPMHGAVAIYVPDDDLSVEVTDTIKRHLYQTGIGLRSISQLDLPFVAGILEASQNPNDPYIVIKHTEYNLQQLLDEGLTLKPKRVYRILLQVLTAIVSMAENSWQTDLLSPSQIKIDDICQGDIALSAIGSSGSRPMATATGSISLAGTLTVNPQKGLDVEFEPTETLRDETIEETQTLKTDPADRSRLTFKPTVTLPADGVQPSEKDVRRTQRNIYILGNIAYQLLFGNKYHRSDIAAAVNIKKLNSKWRTILERALSSNLEVRYLSYEAMLRKVNRSLAKNKRIAIGLTLLAVVLVIVAAKFAWNWYQDYKIRNAPAVQVFKDFLNIIEEENKGFEVKDPSLSGKSDEEILKPFDDINKQ